MNAIIPKREKEVNFWEHCCEQNEITKHESQIHDFEDAM